MEKQILKMYKALRQAGHPAKYAINDAKTIIQFRELEEQGKVKIEAEEEQENYFSIYGEPDSKRERRFISDFIEQYGNWCIITSYQDAQGEMQHADSLGNCIYKKPLCPTENDYLPQMMKAAIEGYYNTFSNVGKL